MKRVISLIFCIISIITLTCLGSVNAEKVSKEIVLNSANMLVNGKAIQETNISFEDRIYVPLRAVFETIGCEVKWDEVTKTASIIGEIISPIESIEDYETNEQSCHSPELELQEIEFVAMTITAGDIETTVMSISYGDRIYVPLRAITDFLGLELNWNDTLRVANIFGSTVINAKFRFITYEEYYATLKAQYDKLIADQIARGDQVYEDYTKNFISCTAGFNEESHRKLAEEARKPYLQRADELKEEFNKKVEALKFKYHIIETSFDEEYIELKEHYDKMIADLIAKADQMYEDTFKHSLANSADASEEGLKLMAEEAKAPYLKRVEELKEEFDKKVELLK